MSGEAREIAIVVGLIPLMWSSVIALLRLITRRGAQLSMQSMRTEVTVLELMLAPVLVGTVLLAVATTSANPPQGLLEQPHLASLASLAQNLAARFSVADSTGAWNLLPVAADTIYVFGFVVAATRLLRARARLRRIAIAGVPCPAFGAEVRFSTEARFSFACAQGIVLPQRLATTLSARDLALIIRHERAHIERGDPRAYWLLAWVDALFWFNPLICRQTRHCRLAAELACDAAVVACAPEARIAYAGALVAALRDAAYAPGCTPGISSTRNGGEYQLRITRILDPAPVRRSTLGRLTVVVAATLLVVPVGVLQIVACVQSARDVINFQLSRDPHGVKIFSKARVAQPRAMPNHPASLATVLRMSEEFRRGEPSVLAPVMHKVFAKLGLMQSIDFVGVHPTGADVFAERYTHGVVTWEVTLAPDGATTSVHLLRKLDSGDTMFWGTFSR